MAGIVVSDWQCVNKLPFSCKSTWPPVCFIFMDTSGETSSEPGQSPRFLYPGEVRRRERAPEEEMTASVGEYPLGLAAQICRHLEGNGIPCEGFRVGSDENVRADIRVHPEHLDDAIALIARGSEPEPAEDEREFEDEVMQSLSDMYICPKCKTRGLKLLPRTSGFRRWRNAYLAVVVTVILVSMFWNVIPDFGLKDEIESLTGLWIILACFCLTALFYMYLANRPPKQCESCGWRSNATDTDR